MLDIELLREHNEQLVDRLQTVEDWAAEERIKALKNLKHRVILTVKRHLGGSVSRQQIYEDLKELPLMGIHE